MKFKILRGHYEEHDPKGGEKGMGVLSTGNKATRRFTQGQVVDTNLDLSAMFDRPGMPPKFERVDEYAVPVMAGPITAEEAARRGFDPSYGNTGSLPTSSPLPPMAQGVPQINLDGMNLRQLQEYAAQEEIDLKGVKNTHADTLKAIKAAFQLA